MAEPSTSSTLESDVEKLLNREASAFQRELEVERILKAFKLKSVPPFTLPDLAHVLGQSV